MWCYLPCLCSTLTLVPSEYVKCPIWLFSVVPCFHVLPVHFCRQFLKFFYMFPVAPVITDTSLFFPDALAKLRKATIRFVKPVRLSLPLCLSVCPSIHVQYLDCHCTGCQDIWGYLRIFEDFWGFFDNLSRNFEFSSNDRNNGCFTRISIHISFTSSSDLLRMRNISKLLTKSKRAF